MYRITEQVWRADGIKTQRTWTPDPFWAEKVYLGYLHQSETTCVHMLNTATKCGCWPSTCTH